MTGRLWRMGALALLVLVLASCGQMAAVPTQAAGEASVARGGGGGVIAPSGQITEGLAVVGSGTASAEPEVAQVVFGVELRGDEPAAIVNEGAQRIDRAIAAAQGLGIPEDDIRTTGYNLWVETVYDPERGIPTGEVVYHLSHYVEVTLRDLDQVGNLLAGVVDAGANTISGVSFTVEDPDALVEQARRQALENAAAQAQQMAAALDIALGKPTAVMEVGGVYPPTAVRVEGIGGGGMDMAAAPSVSPGTFSVSVSIQVVYEIR
jgi:uncharacterized protein YggE